MIAYLEFACIRLVVFLIQRLPYRLLAPLAGLWGTILWSLHTRYRGIILHNLRIAFADGEGHANPSIPLQTTGRISVIRFIYQGLTAAWSADKTDQELQSLYRLTGVQEHLLPAHAKGKGVIHVMFHMGNWEILSRVVGSIPQVKFSTIYQPMKNPHVNRMVESWRERSGVSMINRHHGFQEAVRRLRKGEAVGMLVDQHAGDHGMWVPFFGRMASTTPLPALLAKRTGARIVPLFCHQDGKRWNIEFAKPIETDHRTEGEILYEIHLRLETAIRRDPPSWLWLHRRWKTPTPYILFSKYRRGSYVPSGLTLKPFRLLIRAVNWLGDAVLTLPAIQSIRLGRPDLKITVLTSSKLSGFWRSLPEVDDVVTSVDEASKKTYDVALLLPNSLRSAWEAFRLGIPARWGYAGHSRSWLLTSICPDSYRAKEGEHDVQDFAGLVRWMGGTIHDLTPRFSQILSQPPLPPTQDYLVLHPGAAFGSAKRWIPERFAELVHRFPDHKWIMIGTREEAERNASIASAAGSHLEDASGRYSVEELITLLSRARLLVCNDSGPMHLAAATGTPVLALFGSTDPISTGPVGTGHRIVRHLVECSPCFLRNCPIDLRCMTGITVDRVAAELREMLTLPLK